MAETIIYLDHAATSPLAPDVLDAMLPWLRDGYGNPGSLHRVGRRARQAVKTAREQVAALIGADPREIVFTSGGTEADNLALAGVPAKRTGGLVTTATEHHAVLHTARRLATSKCPVDELPVDRDGLLELDALRYALDNETALVSIMHGNNETGVLQPVDAIAASCREVCVPFHCDAVQAVGHVPVDVSTWPVDLLSLSAHKLGGPKGIGALFVRRGVDMAPQLTGGGQERKRRAGTENVASIVGFGAACERARKSMATSRARLEGLRERLESGILARVPDALLNGARTDRLPHIANIGFAGAEGEGILYGLDAEGICVSTGSACTSGVADPSHVLRAMGQSHVEALGAVRFSLGYDTTEADVDRLLNVLPRVVRELRGT